VELDLVDAVAEAIVAAQLRGVQIGEAAEVEGLGGAQPAAEGSDPLAGPGASLPREALDERPVAAEEVEVLEGRRLVGDLVGRAEAQGSASPGPFLRTGLGVCETVR
jgi:hypothetical protein